MNVGRGVDVGSPGSVVAVGTWVGVSGAGVLVFSALEWISCVGSVLAEMSALSPDIESPPQAASNSPANTASTDTIN